MSATDLGGIAPEEVLLQYLDRIERDEAELAAARTLLVQEHRKSVSEWSGNFGGHIGIRHGWVEWDDDTEIEECAVCDFLVQHAAEGER